MWLWLPSQEQAARLGQIWGTTRCKLVTDRTYIVHTILHNWKTLAGAYYSRHPKWSQNWLISVELVLLCMFQTILLMVNCSWLSSVSISCLFSIKPNFNISMFPVVPNLFARGRHYFFNLSKWIKSRHWVSEVSRLVWLLLIQLKPKLGYFKRLNVTIVKCLY